MIKSSMPHRKVLRDNSFTSNEFFKPATHRMAKYSGAQRVSADMYPALATFADFIIHDVIKRISALIDPRKTIQLSDLEQVVIAYGDKLPGVTGDFKRCTDISPKKKKRRSKSPKPKPMPIYEAGCHFFAKRTFSRAIREATQPHITDARWSDDAINNMMTYIELKLLRILQLAIKAAEHADRKTLYGDDIKLTVNMLSSGCPL
jgi:histone H3/H4